MRYAHHAIRELLRSEGNNPTPVQVMPLVRTQLETLFAICLVLEDPSSLDVYLKDGWGKLYVRYLLTRAEGRNLPRVMVALDKQAFAMEQFRLASGVTDVEKRTIELDELGVPLPTGMAPLRIRQFPSPRRVIRQVHDPERKGMLQRLYPEYQFLCGFVHFSPASRVLSTLFDNRQLPGQWSTTGQRHEIFQKEVAGPALAIDLISVFQSSAEFVSVYPADIELVKSVVEAWSQIAERWLLGQVIWNLRTKRLLGAL